jgi:hypothetical protein
VYLLFFSDAVVAEKDLVKKRVFDLKFMLNKIYFFKGSQNKVEAQKNRLV